MSIHIEKRNEDCLHNSYKEGDVCKVMRYQSISLNERPYVRNYKACHHCGTSFKSLSSFFQF